MKLNSTVDIDIANRIDWNFTCNSTTQKAVDEEYTQLIQKIKRTLKPKDKDEKCLFSDKIKEMLKIRKELKSGNNFIEFTEYAKHVRKTLENEIRERKSKNIIDYIENNCRGLKNVMYLRKGMIELTDDFTKKIDTNEKVICNFYTELYKDDIKSIRNDKHKISDHSEFKPFLESEIDYVVAKSKNEKMTGTDGISNEMIKSLYKNQKFKVALLKRLNFYFMNKIIPKCWGTAILLLLPKKNNLNSIRNYRPLSILSHLFKLFTALINERLKRYIKYKVQDYQTRFRNDISTVDAIYTLKQIMLDSKEFNIRKRVFIFLDFMKCFDMIKREMLYQSMYDLNIDGHIISTVETIQKETKFVDIDNKYNIPIQRGVGQGDSMSPSLFLIIMEHIVREFASKLRKEKIKCFQINGNDTGVIAFADDTCLTGELKKDAQKILVLFEIIAKKHGLVLHPMKTELMCLDEVKIKSLDGAKIKQVQQFTYL
uniref:Reverse transcriptase domain-containing protein n=1 Tax=Strongyloides papillosus TaxID=174720 RepID=A0A0N5C1H9_STREA